MQERDTTKPAPSNGDERRALKAAIRDLLTFAPALHAGPPGMIRGGDYVRIADVLGAIDAMPCPSVADQPVAQEASGWVAQMQSTKADANGRKVIWHRSKFVRTKHDAQMIVAQWREQMPSDVLEYVIAEVWTGEPIPTRAGLPALAAPHPPVSAEPDRYKRALEAILANPGGASAKRIATLALDLDGAEPESAESWEDGNGVIRSGVLPEQVSAEAGKGVNKWAVAFEVTNAKLRYWTVTREMSIAHGIAAEHQAAGYPQTIVRPLFYAAPSESVAVSGKVSDGDFDKLANAHFTEGNNLTPHQWRSYGRAVLALAKTK